MVEDPQTPFRFGVIGPGKRSTHWARILDSLGAEVWYHSPDGDDLSQVLDDTDDVSPEVELPYFFDGYTDLVIFGEDDDQEERHELIVECMRNNVAALVEPPLAITADGAEEIHHAAKKHGTPLLTAFRTIHTSSYRQMAHWSKNILGRLDYIHAMWASPEMNLDPLWDFCCEPTALLHGFERDRPDRFQAQQGPGWLNIIFMSAGSTDINLSILSGTPRPEHCIRILGENGSIECYPFQEEVILRRNDGEVTQSLNSGMGPDRSMLMFFCRRIREQQKEGTEPPHGEIGYAVSTILSQVDENLVYEEPQL